MKPEQKTRFICKTCKGDNLKFDAWAVWDGYQFQLLATLDMVVCDTCDGETKCEQVPCQ